MQEYAMQGNFHAKKKPTMASSLFSENIECPRMSWKVFDM
jgi:hypothetical protein